MGNSEYRKTIDYILDLIRSGMLQVGDKLPTERSISEKLGISRNTVREALRGLEILGIVNGKQGSGNYLTDNISDSIASAMDIMLLMNRTSKEEICSFRRSMEKTVCSYLVAKGCSSENKLKIVGICIFFSRLSSLFPFCRSCILHARCLLAFIDMELIIAGNSAQSNQCRHKSGKEPSFPHTNPFLSRSFRLLYYSVHRWRGSRIRYRP